MKLTIPNAHAPSPLHILRRAGYSAFTDPVSKAESFVLRLGATFYPRFHVYVVQRQNDVTFDLHLDQKQPSYGSASMHNGEYDGPTVEREIRRLETWIQAAAREKTQPPVKTEKPAPKKKFLDWFFE